jgi:fused signal recognition particle receptor
MLVLWIVLAVVLATLVVGLVVAVPRRTRARRTSDSAGVATTTLERPPSAPGVSEPEAPEAEAPEAEAPEAETLEAEKPEAGAGPPPELRERMGKTRGLFSGYVRALRSRSSVDDQAWDDLEEALLRADVGVATTTALLEDLRGRVRDGELRGADAVVAALREDLRRSLDTDDGTALSLDGEGVIVWLVVGLNGVGNTTPIGKVARR